MEWSQPSHPDIERESCLRVMSGICSMLMSGISSVLLLSELVDLSKVVLLATPWAVFPLLSQLQASCPQSKHEFWHPSHCDPCDDGFRKLNPRVLEPGEAKFSARQL